MAYLFERAGSPVDDALVEMFDHTVTWSAAAKLVKSKSTLSRSQDDKNALTISNSSPV